MDQYSSNQYCFYYYHFLRLFRSLHFDLSVFQTSGFPKSGIGALIRGRRERRQLCLRELLDVNDCRSALALFLPFDQSYPFFGIQLAQHTQHTVMTAVEILLDLCHGVVDIHAALLITPAVFCGQSHAVKHKTV